MSVNVQISPELALLACAVGLVDGDGRVDGSWFEDPLERIGTLLSDPVQRSAVFELLEQLFPSAPPKGQGGTARWHPLLDSTWRGNVFVTIDDNVIGIAGAIATDVGMMPGASAVIRLPLIDVSTGIVEIVAGSSRGPLDIEIRAEWNPSAAPSGVAVLATVDLDGHGSLGVVLDNLDPDRPGSRTKLDPSRLDGDAARVLLQLVSDVLKDLPADEPRLARFIEHLPGLLGLDPALSPFPIGDLLRDPSAVVSWLADVTDSPTKLRAWFTHLAGLLGSGLPAAAPTVTGDGSADAPFRAPLLDLGDGAALELSFGVGAAPSGTRELHGGMSIALPTALARVEGAVTFIALPLDGAYPARMLPSAHLVIATSGAALVDTAPAAKLGAVAVGVGWDGARVVPRLELVDVVLEGESYPRLDLMDAHAVGEAASGGISAELDSLLGTTGLGRALQAFLGLVPPTSDMGSPHRLSLSRFLQNPTQAIADVHRRALGDPDHPWDHLFAELATLLRGPTQILGDGTHTNPWRFTLAEVGPATLEFAAWNGRNSETPAASELLRLGLRLGFDQAPWSASGMAELLAVDLAPSGPASVTFLRGFHVAIELHANQLPVSASALQLALQAISVEASFIPGGNAAWQLQARDLTVSGSGGTVGPVTLRLPAAFDAVAADLGLGLPADDVLAIVRLLLSQLLHDVGGPHAFVLGALVGLHRELRGLPHDWPLLSLQVPGDVGSLLADPLAALRAQFVRVTGGASADGLPFAVAALPWVAGLLRGTLPSHTAEELTGYRPGGLGTYDAPWAMPVLGSSLELLCWVEPDGPSKSWQIEASDRLRDTVDGSAFIALLSAVAPLVPELAAAVRARGTATVARQLEGLSVWLASGDGFAFTAAQGAPAPGWSTGDLVPGAHHDQPSAPAAIEQIRLQLDLWANGESRAVLLIGPPFADHRAWNDLLQTIEPDRPIGAHINFRIPDADPLTIPLDHVEAGAQHYTADLADGTLIQVTAQIGRAVERVRALTAADKVLLVAHSVIGIAARAYAAAAPSRIGGIITLGTPHDRSPLAPLIDHDLAEAVRIAQALQPSNFRSPIGRAIGQLAQALDGAPGYALEPFRGPQTVTDAVPGLAIPGVLDGELLSDLAAGAIERLKEAAAGAAPPTSAAFGARLRLDLPAADRGDLSLATHVRVDVARASLGSPGHVTGRRAIEVRLELRRTGGWLAGGPGPNAPARLRWAELGVRLEENAASGLAVIPILRLYEVGAITRPLLDDADLVAMAESLPTHVPLMSEFDNEGAAEKLLVKLLMGAGLVVRDGTGRALLSIEALVALIREPSVTFGRQLTAILDVLAEALGARPTTEGWELPLDGAPITLALVRESWALRIRTHDPATGSDAFSLAPGLSIGADASLAIGTFSAAADARLRLGEASLSWSSRAATLVLDDGFSAAPLSLMPAPAPQVLRAALGQRLPPMLAGALASAVLTGATNGNVRVTGLTRLFASPGAWVLSKDGFGAPGGGLDADKLTFLLEALSRTIGNPTSGSLLLPGGLTLAAAGADPMTATLGGILPLGDDDTLEVRLGVAVDRRLAASPTGSVTLSITLPGTWGQIAISLASDPAGLAVTVAPAGARAIQILPQFSGLDAVAGGAALLLPRVLQAGVDALAPVPQNATGLLRGALGVARALGIYDFDPEGFEAPARTAELARMLQPGWLQEKAASGPAVAGLIADLLGGPAPVLPVPGAVSASGATVSWAYAVGGGAEITASLGWTGAGSEPSLLLGVKKLRLGPVVADEVAAGYDQGPACRVALHLEPEGAVAFMRPAVDLDVVDGRLAFSVYPLGPEEKADFSVQVAPAPELLFHPTAAFALLERWAFPLAVQLLVRECAAHLGNTVWPGGPSIKAVLEQAGVIVPGSNPLEVVASLPATTEVALRALAALTANVSIELVPGELTLSMVAEGGRHGIRLQGHQALIAGETVVDLRFGKADWFDDPLAGVTLWLLEDTTGLPPVQIAPSLDVSGLGVVLSGKDAPMLQGAFEVGGAGGFLFFDVAFLDGARNPAVQVSGLGAGVELNRARINVASDDGDSFLQKILPKELRAPFDLAVAYIEGEGLTFHGGSPGGGVELTFPLDLDLVLLRLEELFLALRTKNGTASIEAALTGSASLGPIFASVQRVGVKATFASGGARLGFRAPDGLALSIDAGPVSGGGFLFIDEPKGQYAGAIQLELQTLSLTAIGLLNTKLPDGQPIPGLGFSLLVIIAVELPPIQLGFGFTLNGIGGLLGLNRTMDLAALRAGVRNRALDAMLFPQDPIRNATSVVRNLSAVFPVAVDRFVVGPMVRLGWGTPPILTLDIGIILELPDPIRIAILGRIKLALPEDGEKAVVRIHLDVAGTIDFDRGEVSIDAVLYDSVIAAFTLSGEMALRARWKNDPAFVLAIGGFHPAYRPPPGFPTLTRVAIALATGDNPRVRLEAYLAVTSNTIQFGAAIDVHAEASEFAIDGNLLFDALIQLDPFGLMADMAGSFSVSWDGDVICAVGAAVHLTGPSPWHVWGKAHVEVLCLSADVDFDAHIGQAALPTPPRPVRVVDLLLAAIAEAANWSALAPPGEGVVALRSSREGARVLAHPLGGLTFRQRVAPLELTLTRYGAAAVDGPARLELGEVHCADMPVPKKNRKTVSEPFPAAQFLDLSDNEKLSRPSFEQFASGVELRFDGWVLDELAAGEAAALNYEVVVIDAAVDEAIPPRVTLSAAVAIRAAAQGPAGVARMRRGGLRRFEAPGAQVEVTERRFGVIGDSEPAPITAVGNYTQALEAARQFARHGERITVVPFPIGDEP